MQSPLTRSLVATKSRIKVKVYTGAEKATLLFCVIIHKGKL